MGIKRVALRKEFFCQRFVDDHHAWRTTAILIRERAAVHHGYAQHVEKTRRYQNPSRPRSFGIVFRWLTFDIEWQAIPALERQAARERRFRNARKAFDTLAAIALELFHCR